MKSSDGATAATSEDSLTSVSSALLREQLAIQGVYETRNAGAVSSLWVHVANALETDMDTACKMLEIIPEVWSRQKKSKQVCYSLCNLYVEICKLIRDPGVRILALSNLKELMDDVLAQGRSMAGLLPSSQNLRELWEDIQAEDINPGLSHATLAVSGPIMATFIARREPGTEHMCKAWGDMLADALDVDNVSILRGYCSATRTLVLTTSRPSTHGSPPQRLSSPFAPQQGICSKIQNTCPSSWPCTML